VATIEGLGGARHLAALKTAHHGFGLAYGFLKHTAVGAEEITDTRAEQLSAQAALREFIFKLSAQADEDEPDSIEMVRFILQPYSALVVDLARSSRKPAKPAAQPTPAPAPAPK
jgi:hypothetical protein